MAVTIVDRSGSITTGGTAQNFITANPDRLGWLYQNISTENHYLSDVGTALAAGTSSFVIYPGCVFESAAVSGGAVSVVAATTGSKFVAREW